MHIDTFHFILCMCLKCDITDYQYTCLYAQDLECDVSVEDDNRQEWIFTLYDFDNSGKVTKEVCVLNVFPLLVLCFFSLNLYRVFLIMLVSFTCHHHVKPTLGLHYKLCFSYHYRTCPV